MSMPLAEYIRTHYMSCRLDVPPQVASAAYDERAGSLTDQRWEVEANAARLDLRGPVCRYSGSGWRPLRSQLGTLTVGRHRWPVELELLPWSRDRTELGLRPYGRRLRVSPPENGTLAGLTVLDRLAETIQVWADQPLRDWAQGGRVQHRLGDSGALAV
jgi:hypothetical protein